MRTIWRPVKNTKDEDVEIYGKRVTGRRENKTFNCRMSKMILHNDVSILQVEISLSTAVKDENNMKADFSS